MSKYVNVDYFVEALCKTLSTLRKQKDNTPESIAFLKGAQVVAKELMKFPAADVVVRCKNCVHYHPCTAELIDGSTPEWGYCDQPWFNDDQNDVDEMFYCAQGERREDKTDKCFNEHRAHWIKENDICYNPDASCSYAEYSCSYCGAWANDRSELPECCPNCGKKMKGAK